MQYRSNKGFTAGAQLGLLIGLAGAGMVLVGLVQLITSFFLLPPGTPMELVNDAMMRAMKDPSHVGYARFLQAAGTFLLFFVPAVLFSGITQGWNRMWLGFNRHAGILQFTAGFGLIFVANIAASSLEETSKWLLNFFPSVDRMALELENAYNDSVKIIGLIRTWPELLTAIVIMAFLPALFEETFFRGALQQLLYRWWHSPVFSILITSLLFSLIHFSVYLFLSRFLLGLALGIMFYLTRNIWISIVAHFMNNAIAVFQLYIAGREKKEIDMNELTPHYGPWLMATAFACMFILGWLLNRVSVNYRVLIIDEERSVN